jgi:hypothetical protein
LNVPATPGTRSELRIVLRGDRAGRAVQLTSAVIAHDDRIDSQRRSETSIFDIEDALDRELAVPQIAEASDLVVPVQKDERVSSWLLLTLESLGRGGGIRTRIPSSIHAGWPPIPASCCAVVA